MALTLNSLSGIAAGGKLLAPTLTVPIFSSRTWTAPQNGYVLVGAIGAGGSGAYWNGGSTCGGYSGAWGQKLLKVSKGTVITVAIGSGGAAKTVAGTSGNAGGATTITVDGVTYTAPGGLGGVYAATGVAVLPSPAALSPDWDIGAVSVKPGAAASVVTGGAGVDILAQGSNATTSAASACSGGGGTGSPSLPGGSPWRGGGAMPSGSDINGALSTDDGTFALGPDLGWGISFYGGGGGVFNPSTAKAGRGGNGGGGAGSDGYESGKGGNGGGGGGGPQGGDGGLGGGGGATQATSKGAGGNGYACINFAADMGV